MTAGTPIYGNPQVYESTYRMLWLWAPWPPCFEGLQLHQHGTGDCAALTAVSTSSPWTSRSIHPWHRSMARCVPMLPGAAAASTAGSGGRPTTCSLEIPSCGHFNVLVLVSFTSDKPIFFSADSDFFWRWNQG